MLHKYILRNHIVERCDSRMEWFAWYESSGKDRRVALTNVDGMEISTVFLGLDHAFGGGPPELFETMVFDTNSTDRWAELQCRRCSTWVAALHQHAQITGEVKGLSHGPPQ